MRLSASAMRHAPINRDLFISNRERLTKLLQPNSLVIVNSNDVPPANADGTLAMPVNSDLFYLTGIEQEQTILLLYPGADDEKNREILFLRDPVPDLELWEGHKLTRKEARDISGLQNVHWLSEFRQIFHRLMCECERVYLNSNEHKRAVIEVETREARFVAETLRRYPLHEYHRLARLMHQLRAAKSQIEVDLVRTACQITGRAFTRVLKRIKPGIHEFEVEAEFAREFIRNRARFAYLPIIASGANACSLHYIANSSSCRRGELLLLDVAACYANYNADLTRTLPVSGRFTRRQKQVYNAVLRALRASIRGLVPGKKSKDWQKEAEQFIERELVELGLLKMSEIKAQSPEQPALKRYFMHGVGHPLGLDVHDVAFTTEPMAAGWIMTVEPGIYIREEDLAVRLENNVLLTPEGPVDLMAGIPIEAEEIEELMASTGKARSRKQ